MRTDTVCAVMRLDKHLTEDYSTVWKETYVDEGKGYLVFCGHGAAEDCFLSEEQVERLNNLHGGEDTKYISVRVDIEDAVKEGLI